jgi:hypothetical protein
VVPLIPFGIDQMGENFIIGELAVHPGFQRRLIRGSHPVEPELPQFTECLLITDHVCSSVP